MESPSAAEVSRSRRLREWFDDVTNEPPEKRSVWLEKHVLDAADRAALERLLAADAGLDDRILATPAAELAGRIGEMAEPVADEFIGERIGGFRLTRLIGRGGMGTVFLGEREGADFEQHVAVKLLRRGLYTDFERRLFRREQQALAGLSHPNIARLIDGGVTPGGIPFLVIEYVDGKPVTRFAAEARLGIRARLELFVLVCRAVAAAHRNLIVHRDIKPDNILVDREGAPKLLDFGIAKLLSDEDPFATNTAHNALTPAYAAPEQITGNVISTATDVFALGVVLHELLLGRRATQADGSRPSTRVDAQALAAAGLPIDAAAVRAALRGDLDNILLKAMAEESERRYATAAELADDIDRFLCARPVRAHPPSRRYRARKFVQRHRGGVVLTVIFILGLFASLGAVVWQANIARDESARATEQARLARSEALRANVVRDFVVGVFDSARASLPRDLKPTPEALVAQAQRRLTNTNGLDAPTTLDLQRTLGKVSLSLSAFDAAAHAFDAALAVAPGRASGTRESAESWELRVLRADAWQRQGRNADAAREIEPMLPRLRREGTTVTRRALAVLASVRESQGNVPAAVVLRNEVARMTIRQEGVTSADALAALIGVGISLSNAELHPEALAVLEPALAAWRRLHAAEDARHVAGLESLLVSGIAQGKAEGLEARALELHDLSLRIYPPEHDAIAASLVNLAAAALFKDDFATAESRYSEALAMRRTLFGDVHPSMVGALTGLAATLGAQQRGEESISRYNEALRICERLKIRDVTCIRARNNRGQQQYRMGRMPEARVDMTWALDARRSLLGAEHPSVAYSLSTLANAWMKDDAPRAVRYAEEAVALLERTGNGASRDTAQVRNTLAQALFLDKHFDEALGCRN